jgi:hypothetical protein
LDAAPQAASAVGYNGQRELHIALDYRVDSELMVSILLAASPDATSITDSDDRLPVDIAAPLQSSR